MPENKEFEKWFRDIYRCCDEDSVLCAFEKDSQDAFEAGQQSERNKHRWIPVTERLPTENDGKPEYEGDERYTRIIVHITEYYGKKWDRVMEIRFFEGTDFSQFCYKFDKWQPLPEA